ncbi:energy transducer TonB [Dyella sp. C9]|uniref:energy transducer TonB n=1 Tax=Dyella sp. C9 TaxID=2202154 RepID=UPI001300744B|nr:energy transducer TonB [Dyella sp. C9]
MGKGIWIWAAVLAGVATAAGAGSIKEEVHKQAEASMLVTGTVQVNQDGTVQGYTLDKPDQLPAPVVQLIAKNVPHWTFQHPPTTDPVYTTSMSLRLLADPVDGDNFRLTIQGASFGDKGTASGETVSMKSRIPPRYPQEAARAGVSGTVYLLLRVGRDGHVEDVIAEQVNLDQYASRGVMNHFRDTLSNAALDVARQWTFNTPTQGGEVDAPYWVARVPVAFNLNKPNSAGEPRRYGTWRMYIPGPRQVAPWVKDQRLLATAPDAVADDGLHTLGTGLQLTSPLGSGG